MNVPAVLEPLVPPECDCSGLPFMPLEVGRLLDSDLMALSTGDEFKAALMLWCKSWAQAPAASLPDDDRILARWSGATPSEWKQMREMALRGWVKCSDGRLYHPLIADLAVKAHAKRKDQSARANSRWAKVRAGKEEEKQRSRSTRGIATGSPHGNAGSMQGEGEGEYQVSVAKEATAPNGASRDLDKEAWDHGVQLLTDLGRTERASRAFFGKLLSLHQLQAKDLLPVLAAAAVNGTQDAEAYLSKSAASISRRRGLEPHPSEVVF